MAAGSRVCPSCRALNAADDARCHRCAERLPGPWGTAARELVGAVAGAGAPATTLVVGFCLIVYLGMGVGDGSGLYRGGGLGAEALRWGALMAGAVRVEPWRYLSAVFVHLGILHAAFNLLALHRIGGGVERAVGSARFLVAFGVTGVLGFVASDLWYGPRLFTAGASGAIFGLGGVRVGWLLVARDPAWKQAAIELTLYAVIATLLLPRVNDTAHVVGGLAGVGCGALFGRERRGPGRDRAARVLAAAVALASVGSVLLAQRSPYWQVARQAEIDRGLR
ncbi:MAG: rhomboid family intramembrane serine protease [Polyangiaceae bacterium]|nr:rhomboid family intramembrane serine protease [Polyangiaceae bacterium]